MTQLLPPKKEVALALLERSNVDVYLDPRAKGVVVPPQFRKEPRLILKIGLNMPVPIPDLRLDDESMSCTLSFNRAKFYCVVPWLSVFAMVGDDGRGMVWPDDVPQELAVRVVDEPERARGEVPETPEAPEGARAKPRLSPAERPDEGRSKKPRKKKEAPRPVLMAVPSPDASRAPDGERAPAQANAQQKKQRAPAPRSPAAQAPPRTPPRVPGAPASRPKRELPPYLRVVK